MLRLVCSVTTILLFTLAAFAQEKAPGKTSSSTKETMIMGSAFLISKEGHVLTCSHCLVPETGLKETKVVYQQREHLAKVLVNDARHDFALLKLETNVEYALPICLEEPAQGSEVRAFGFPLANLLGAGMKVTRGSIAGKLDEPDRHWLQIDALINPGNSGGALVNEHGAVIGITNAILNPKYGQMGFAVSVHEFRAMLDSNKVPYIVNKPGAKLDGPELVKQVAPAVLPILGKRRPAAVAQQPRRPERPDPSHPHLPRQFQVNPTDNLVDVRSSHGTFPSQRPAFGKIFRDIEGDDAMLVGFKVATRQGAFNQVVVGMQPVYLRKNQEVYGKAYGTNIVSTHMLIAKPGYAVGGMRCHSGLWMDAVQVVFMKIDGDHLDTKDTYLSNVAGSEEKITNEDTLTEGRMVVGVHGNVNEKKMLISIGLVVKAK